MATARGLRVGLTGGLGSGKSTVARLFADLGAHILSADEIARDLMQPGTQVFTQIVARFGPTVLREDGTLNRPELARLAFAGGRVDELNRIIHPATIARQGELADEILALNQQAIVIVESALIFETKYGSGWRDRFNRMILVTTPDELKIQRFTARALAQDPAADPARLKLEARRRLAQMIPDCDKAPQCDFVLSNDGTLEQLRSAVSAVWQSLGQQGDDAGQAVTS